MERYGNLWPDIIAFENLLLAARKAQRGKRYQPNVLQLTTTWKQNCWRCTPS